MSKPKELFILIFGLILQADFVLLILGAQINLTPPKSRDGETNAHAAGSRHKFTGDLNIPHRYFSREQPKRQKYPFIPEDQGRRDDEEYSANYDAEESPASSNFSAFMYDNDDNPALFPNPELMVYDADTRSKTTAKQQNVVDELPDVDLPDDSLADADLRDHNLIDSVTYLYGISGVHPARMRWVLMVLATRMVAFGMTALVALYLLLSDSAAAFRRRSRLYPLHVNLLCCLLACNAIYVGGILDTRWAARCEVIALLLHYAHLVCAAWLLVLCCSVVDFAARASVPDLRYNYLFAYGVPAVMVLFFYALSVEHYETKYYCWMSLEKGMLIGFMLPVTVLILITTALVLLGLKNISKKQNEILASKIHEFINQQTNEGGGKKLDEEISRRESSDNTIDTDHSVEDGYCENEGKKNVTDSHNELHARGGEDNEVQACLQDEMLKYQSIKFDIINLSIDNLSWKSASFTEIQQLRSYLNFCLVMQPLFGITWVIGVVALENAAHWLSPTVFMVICLSMYLYMAVQLVRVQPIVRSQADELPSCCEEIVSETTCVTQRSTDSIPLLVTGGAPPPPAPSTTVDTISTISI